MITYFDDSAPLTQYCFVDVYSWLKQIELRNDGSVCAEGIFRHAYLLCLYVGMPAVFLKSGETICPKAAAALTAVLRAPVVVFRDGVNDLSTIKMWWSCAVDCSSPILEQLSSATCRKLAIVHDTIAVRPDKPFGQSSADRFDYGLRWNDELLFVSEYAKTSLHTYLTPELKKVKSWREWSFTGFHSYNSLPIPNKSLEREHFALGVASLYARKNIIAAVNICLENKIQYVHAGLTNTSFSADSVADSVKWLHPQSLKHIGSGVKMSHFAEDLRVNRWPHFLGSVSDKMLTLLYSRAWHFFNLSTEEGFSLTPMEAMIHRVPFVYLSSIPAHEEVYGEIYCPLDCSDWWRWVHLKDSGEPISWVRPFSYNKGRITRAQRAAHARVAEQLYSKLHWRNALTLLRKVCEG